MTELTALAAPLSAVLAAAVIPLFPTAWLAAANRVAAVVVALISASAVAASVIALVYAQPGGLDVLGVVFVAVSATIGLSSAMLSPSYLRHGAAGFFGDGPRWYYFAFFLFWAALLAIPQAGNLGIAWVLVAVSTGLTCLLVAYSGTSRALEAGWKYLILTTLGVVVALLGILILFGSTAHVEESLAALDWSVLNSSAATMTKQTTAVVLIFITVGFAAKIGWAPLQHWLPDAHSEAPAPVSAMLSAVLLPTAILVLWRLDLAVSDGPPGSPRWLLLGFGLLSLAVAVPFLWAPLPVKRLLAYSSLEHMGIIAIGLGFADPIATSGVLLHVVGHALAKALGFQVTLPLLRRQPAAARLPLRAGAATSPSAATGLGISLGALAGLPPSPLFISELLILAGGVAAGQVVVVAVAALLLALAFVGLVRQGLEALFANARHKPVGPPTSTSWWWLPAVFGALMIGLDLLAWFVFSQPGWASLAEALT